MLESIADCSQLQDLQMTCSHGAMSIATFRGYSSDKPWTDDGKQNAGLGSKHLTKTEFLLRLIARV